MSESTERLLRLAAWFVVGSVGTVVLTQAVGLDVGSLLAALQALTPYGVLVLVPTLTLAITRRWWDVGAVGGAVGLGGVALAVPLVFPTGQPTAAADATPVEIAVVNLLFENDRTEDIADRLVEIDADVVVFTEFTAEHQAALHAHRIIEDYEHRVELDGLYAGGTAVWARLPLVEQPSAEMVNYDVDVEVQGPDGTFRLWAVHPPTPFHPGWRGDLRTVADRATTIDEPLVIAGDFNASYWHPVFRDILRSGLTAAHIANDRGWSTSWPLGRIVPPFVRIDHALTNDRLVSTHVRDFEVPGSDHRGFVVTVLPAA